MATLASPQSAAVRLRNCRTCGEPPGRCGCLHDIRDPHGFVHATIRRARLVLTREENDELHAEGMAILCRLAEDYRPHIDGHDREGRFSGYAAMFLPRKLGDAWHRMHPEHQHVSQADGSRRWVYGERAVSLEALTAEDPDRHAIMASTGPRYDLQARLLAALTARSAQEHEWVVQVAKRIGAGQQPATVASELGLSEQLVRRYMRQITRCLPDTRHQFTKVSELREALRARAELDAERAARVGELLGEGETAGGIAEILELDISEVRDHEEAIRRVWHIIESGSQ